MHVTVLTLLQLLIGELVLPLPSDIALSHTCCPADPASMMSGIIACGCALDVHPGMVPHLHQTVFLYYPYIYKSVFGRFLLLQLSKVHP